MIKCKGPCGRDLPESAYSMCHGKKGKPSYRAGKCKDCRDRAGLPPLDRYEAAPAILGPSEPAIREQATPEGMRPMEAAAVAPDPLQVTLEAHRKQMAQRDVSRENKALINELHRKDKLLAELGVGTSTPEILVYDKASWERADAVCVAIASDWHVEEPVDKASVHGRNEYNLDVAKSRARHFFQNALKLTDKEARDSIVRTLVVDLLGDFFSGWIHEELTANTLLAPGDAMLFARGLLISGIDFLLANSEYNFEFNCVPGNHGRMTKQMHFGDPSGTSLESVMYTTLADRFHDNPRVRFNNPGHAMIYRTYFEKFVVRLIHGYEVKYGGGVGGVTIPLNKAIAQWDQLQPACVTEYGHFHQFLPGPRSIGNGSLIGYNLFAQAIKAGFEEAMQALYVIHARNGGTRAGIFPIWLDGAHKLAHANVQP